VLQDLVRRRIARAVGTTQRRTEDVREDRVRQTSMRWPGNLPWHYHRSRPAWP